MKTQMSDVSETAQGPRYFVNVEGNEYPWERETITVAEIRTLGGIPDGMPVVEEDPEGNERTLSDGDVVVLKPGHRLGRAPRYRRGAG